MRLLDEHALGVLEFLEFDRELADPPARRVERRRIAGNLGHRRILSRDPRPQEGQFALKLWQQLVRHDHTGQLQSASTSTAIRAAAGTTIGGTNQSATAKAFVIFPPM